MRGREEIKVRLENYRKNLSMSVGKDAAYIIRRAIVELEWMLGGAGK